MKTIIKHITYKGHTILSVEDEIGQQYEIIVGVYNLFASVLDAKRFINGQPTVSVIEYAPIKHNPRVDEFVTIFNNSLSKI